MIKKDSLLHIYYEKAKHNSSAHDKFIQYAIDTLNKIGMTNIWVDQLTKNLIFNEASIIRKIKTRMTDMSSQTILGSLKNNHRNNHGKLEFLASIKTTHNAESYLNIDNIKNRRAITRLRTSSHCLEIESGRWNEIPRLKRICKNCVLNKVEDEKHFMFECHMYNNERREFVKAIKADLKSAHTQNTDQFLREIFESEDLSVLNKFGRFIKNALQKRENTICYVLPQQYVFYQTKT